MLKLKDYQMNKLKKRLKDANFIDIIEKVVILF